jgi:hypothetical protein
MKIENLEAYSAATRQLKASKQYIDSSGEVQELTVQNLEEVLDAFADEVSLFNNILSYFVHHS